MPDISSPARFAPWLRQNKNRGLHLGRFSRHFHTPSLVVTVIHHFQGEINGFGPLEPSLFWINLRSTIPLWPRSRVATSHETEPFHSLSHYHYLILSGTRGKKKIGAVHCVASSQWRRILTVSVHQMDETMLPVLP